MINPEAPTSEPTTVLEQVGHTIIHHVSNSGPIVELPPLFGIDLSISKHVIMLWVTAAVVFGVAYIATKRFRTEKLPVPTGLSNAFEFVVEFLRDQIVFPNLGKENSGIWSPLIFTFFF